MLKAAQTWEMAGLTVNGADKNQKWFKHRIKQRTGWKETKDDHSAD